MSHLLAPKTQPLVLLPEDFVLMRMLGITQAQYRKFWRDTLLATRVRPISGPVAFGWLGVVLVIGLILSVASVLLAPTTQQPKVGKIETRQQQGQNLINPGSYAPKNSFGSVQNVVELQSRVPLVYAKREVIDGVTYGGIRVSTNLLWSYIAGDNGSQMLRAVLLISEGGIGTIDPYQIAIGDNLISSYLLDAESIATNRLTIYFRPNGGRITSADYLAGSLPELDRGNAQRYGAADVYRTPNINNLEWYANFCYASKPSNQTVFGVYGVIGNNLSYRINPFVRPVQQASRVASGGSGNTRVVCTKDVQQKAIREKMKATFVSRAYITNPGNKGDILLANKGDEITYTIFTQTDKEFVFREREDGPDGEEGCGDVASSIASRLKGYDDLIVLGGLYKIGSAIAVCTTRSANRYVSTADVEDDSAATEVSAVFKVIRPGYYMIQAQTDDPSEFNEVINDTNTAHIMRVSIATIITERNVSMIEVHIRSRLGIEFSNFCNIREARSWQYADNKACLDYEGNILGGSDVLSTLTYSSGVVTTTEERYSFWRIIYREAGTDTEYTELPDLVGVRSITNQDLISALRVEPPYPGRWEISFVPVSGWEIRSGYASGRLFVIDFKLPWRTRNTGGFKLGFNGLTVGRNSETFELIQGVPKRGDGTTYPLGWPQAEEGNYIDKWGKLAMTFIYDEIRSSASQPEHEIININQIVANNEVPTYDRLATAGLNIMAGPELPDLSQVSIYINEGLQSTHLFPEILYDQLTNTDYGLGHIYNAQQIDKPSFDACAQWNYDRRYFCDIAIDSAINVRSEGSELAARFLLILVTRNGKLYLEPVANFDGPEEITNLFTAGNIYPDTFEFVRVDNSATEPVIVSVKWREERSISQNYSSGLFPVVQEVTVREASTPETAQIVPIDASDYCTSEQHAIDIGKFEARRRRLFTKQARLKTRPFKTALQLAGVVKLGLETVKYNKPVNGSINSQGDVISMPELDDGTYDVILWTGTENIAVETTIEIINGKSSPPNSVFSLASTEDFTDGWKIAKTNFDEDGNIDVELTYFPLAPNNQSLLTLDWDNPEAWVIEGLNA